MPLVDTRFLTRYGPYFPGANPRLEEALAAKLAAQGFCVIADTNAEARIQKLREDSDKKAALAAATTTEKSDVDSPRDDADDVQHSSAAGKSRRSKNPPSHRTRRPG